MANIDANMNNRQLPNGRNGYAITQPSRPRGLVTQTSTVLLQPGLFFRSLTALEYTRQWLWIGLVILALVGISAVRQASLSEVSSGPPPLDFTEIPAEGGRGILGPGIPPMDTGAPPFDPSLGSGTGSTNVASTWTIALVAASSVMLGWVIQTALLAEVSLLRGFAPRLGHNLQIAIWSSVPLGLMAALQLLYYAAGGSTGDAGVSGLLAEWEGYSQLPTFAQAVMLSLTSRLTLFWLWSLILIYIGARRALGGQWWSALLVVIAWVVVVVVMPVITGAIKAPEADDLSTGGEMTDIIPGDLDFLSGGGDDESGLIMPDATEDPEGNFTNDNLTDEFSEVTEEASLDEASSSDNESSAEETPSLSESSETAVPVPSAKPAQPGGGGSGG